MKKSMVLLAMLLAFPQTKTLAAEADRYSVVKVEVQDQVSVTNPNSSNRIVARVRLKQGTSPERSMWFELDDAAGYGKVKLGLFLSAVTSGRQVEVYAHTNRGSIFWAIDSWPGITDYCYLVAVTQ